MKRIKSVVLLCAVMLSGCEFQPTADSTDTNVSVLTKGLDLPPGTNAIVAVKSTAGPSSATKSSTVAAQVDPAGAGVVLDSAFIVLKEIELYQTVDDADEGTAGGTGDGEDDATASADGGDASGDDVDADAEGDAPADGDDAGGVDDAPGDDLVAGETDDGADDGEVQDDDAAGEGDDASGDGDSDDSDDSDDDGGKIKLKGPFLVDLLEETVLNLGTSSIDDDADDDGVKDVDDSDDDGDGKPDDDDSDDDDDGVPDEDDQTIGESPVLDAVELPPGTYHRIKFKLDRLDADDAPTPDDPMIGFSILVTGSIDGVQMEYCATFKGKLEFRSTEGIVVEPDLVATFLLTVDPIGWFADVDPLAGTLSEDGVLRICGDDNPDLAEIVRDAVRQRARLGRDEDGDGHDDDDEDGDLEDDSDSEDGDGDAEGDDSDSHEDDGDGDPSDQDAAGAGDDPPTDDPDDPDVGSGDDDPDPDDGSGGG